MSVSFYTVLALFLPQYTICLLFSFVVRGFGCCRIHKLSTIFLSSLCWQKNEEGERGLDAILNKEYCFAPKMDTHRSLEEYLCKSVLLQNCSFYSAATVLALAACGMTSLTPLKWQPVPQSSVRFSHHIRWLPPISTNSRPSVEQTERKRCKTAIY